MPRHWTNREQTALIKAFDQFKDFPQVDAVIVESKQIPNRSQNAIRAKRSEMGLVLRHSPKTKYNRTKAQEARQEVKQTRAQVLFDYENLQNGTEKKATQGAPVSIREENLPNDTGAQGSIVIFAYSGSLDFQARNLSRSSVLKILGQIVQKLA